MKIAVLGTGNVGRALGEGWIRSGHEVIFGARSASDYRPNSLGHDELTGVVVGSCRQAIAQSDVVLLAVPWEAARGILNDAQRPSDSKVDPPGESIDLTGKILIDCMNPLTADLSGLQFGYSTSAAEQLAEWYPGSEVVKAFNTLSAATMENPLYGDTRADMFFCGDSEGGKRVVAELAQSIGMVPIDCGPLRIARQLEPLAMLYVHLAIFEGWGGNCALKMLKRSELG